MYNQFVDDPDSLRQKRRKLNNGSGSIFYKPVAGIEKREFQIQLFLLLQLGMVEHRSHHIVSSSGCVPKYVKAMLLIVTSCFFFFFPVPNGGMSVKLISCTRFLIRSCNEILPLTLPPCTLCAEGESVKEKCTVQCAHVEREAFYDEICEDFCTLLAGLFGTFVNCYDGIREIC